MTLAAIPGLGSEGPTELIILLTIILLLFGAKRIPELGKDQGSDVREFRRVNSALGSLRKSRVVLTGIDPSNTDVVNVGLTRFPQRAFSLCSASEHRR